MSVFLSQRRRTTAASSSAAAFNWSPHHRKDSSYRRPDNSVSPPQALVISLLDYCPPFLWQHPLKDTSTWYRAVNGSGPVYIQDLVKRYNTSTPLCIDQSAAPSL
ncbi:unnamed protein product [Pleuronectes platessa]|uniref:Uncharacterized protein n=1 Tax=Pleuronectes platessa TaxID=8262 RepID=A0A9N7VZI8_PLEPL|nr:unnamed protein product [Pleuronectes platessa]